MTIDNPVFLPASFTPSERDVICAWARQNHRHGTSESLLSGMMENGNQLLYSPKPL